MLHTAMNRRFAAQAQSNGQPDNRAPRPERRAAFKRNEAFSFLVAIEVWLLAIKILVAEVAVG